MTMVLDDRLRADLADAPVGLLVTDVAGTVVWTNAAAAAIFESSPEELTGRPVDSLVPAPRRAAHAAVRGRFLVEGSPLGHGASRVLSAVTARGHEIAVEVTLIPLRRAAAGHVLALVEGFGARPAPLVASPAHEAPVQRGERLYRAVFDQSYQATWILSTDGAVLAANRRARGIMLREDGGSGQDVLAVAFPRATQSSRASLAMGLAAAQEGEPIRLVFDDIDGGGGARCHDVTVRPALSDAGKPLFLVLEAREVTEARRREEELVAARLAAEAADRAKAAFLARMSHEMRTPLHAVLGFTRLLLDTPGRDTAESDALRQIESSGEHLLELVEDVLEIARIEAGGLAVADAPANIHDLLLALVGSLRAEAEARGVDLRVELDPGLPTWLLLDEKKLRRALTDLLAHAVAVTLAGQVTLASTWEPEGRRHRLALALADGGPGLDADALSLLYSPFDATEPLGSPGGTGLGLALARRLILLIGGEFRVESTPGRGSRFRIEVPARPVEGLRDAPEPGASAASGTAGLEALVELPDDLLGELGAAAAVADWRRLAAAVERAATAVPALRAPLTAALERFDYTTILTGMPTSWSVSSAREAQSGRVGTSIEASGTSSSTGSGFEKK